MLANVGRSTQQGTHGNMRANGALTVKAQWLNRVAGIHSGIHAGHDFERFPRSFETGHEGSTLGKAGLKGRKFRNDFRALNRAHVAPHRPRQSAIDGAINPNQGGQINPNSLPRSS
jgi:hypothetical protein